MLPFLKDLSEITMKSLFCIVLVLCSVVQLTQGQQTCAVLPDDRETQLRLKINCGKYTIRMTRNFLLVVNTEIRIAGEFGIDEETCLNRSCCWRESIVRKKIYLRDSRLVVY